MRLDEFSKEKLEFRLRLPKLVHARFQNRPRLVCIVKAAVSTETDLKYITCRALLSIGNNYVGRMNMRMIGRFDGVEMVYHSFNYAKDDRHNY